MRYEVVFVRPADLGRGGLILDWKTVSTKQPVAILSIDATENLSFRWIGFKNELKQHLVKFPDPEFYEGKEITMTQCLPSTT